MMFGYADDRALWQAGPVPIAMTAFWGLPIWAIYFLITGVTGPGIEGTVATARGASWASAWPMARSTPVRTGGSAMSFPRAKAAVVAGTVTA